MISQVVRTFPQMIAASYLHLMRSYKPVEPSGLLLFHPAENVLHYVKSCSY